VIRETYLGRFARWEELLGDLHICDSSDRIERNAIAYSEVPSNDADVFGDWIEPVDLIRHGWGWSETQYVPIARMWVRKWSSYFGSENFTVRR
jgi:hypothetical protein